MLMPTEKMDSGASLAGIAFAMVLVIWMSYWVYIRIPEQNRIVHERIVSRTIPANEDGSVRLYREGQMCPDGVTEKTYTFIFRIDQNGLFRDTPEITTTSCQGTK